jgi:anaerobic magnesium-protoporphyrin IX monomethyl ester cyclase
MSHILLVSPNSPFLIDARTFPPLGLLYLGAALEAHGHTCTVVDLAFDTPLAGHNPDLIGVMCLTPHFPQMKGLLDDLHLLYPGVPVAVGGPHFSTVPADGARVGAEVTVVGDGEEQIVRIAEGDWQRGQVMQSPGGIVDVNKVPIPARHLLPIAAYQYQIAGLKATTAITQRGCPYECSFCCHWEGYRKVRLRHTDNIVMEVRRLKAQGFGAIQYYDDELNLNHKRTIEMCEALKHEGIKWRSFIKANLFNEAQAKAFADSGCWELCTGVESGSDAILKTIQKKATVADNTRARQLCRDHGIRFKAFAMVGHPGETRETAYMTRDWLIANDVSEFNLSLFTPYLGTPNFDHPERYDLQFDKLDYSQAEYFYRGKPGEYQAHARTSALSGEELARLRDEIENEVRERLGLPKQGNSLTWNTARTHDQCAQTEVG